MYILIKQKAEVFQLYSNAAFTIVELLVVIVIIGILAAVTLVSYSSISKQAVISSMQSDLSNASTALKAFQVEIGNYPFTISADCSASPDTQTNKCLEPSGDNVFSNYVASNSAVPKTFSLTVSNPSHSYSYVITSESKPISLAPAPNGPVADWLATLQGDHYGNYYDLVGKQWATVTRTTPKTIYDPNTQKIYDVPAGKLAINPRSDGKGGSEAVIEESRTNYLINSYGATNLGNIWSSWAWGFYGVGTPAVSLSKGTYDDTAQRVQYTGEAGDTGVGGIAGFSQTTATGSFAAGENAVASIYAKGSVSGCVARFIVIANHDSTSIDYRLYDLPLSSDWKKYTVSYSSLPANTNKITVGIQYRGVGEGDSFDMTFDAIQLEKGTFATSYIPTTTGAETRNVDWVYIPTSLWNTNSGTIYTVSSEPGAVSNSPSMIFWRMNDAQRIWQHITSTNITTFYASGGGSQAYAQASNPNTYDTIASRWSVGSVSKLYINTTGTAGTTVLAGDPVGLPSTAVIGNAQGSSAYNGGVQRVTVYSVALSDTDALIVTNLIKDGPQ